MGNLLKWKEVVKVAEDWKMSLEVRDRNSDLDGAGNFQIVYPNQPKLPVVISEHNGRTLYAVSFMTLLTEQRKTEGNKRINPEQALRLFEEIESIGNGDRSIFELSDRAIKGAFYNVQVWPLDGKIVYRSCNGKLGAVVDPQLEKLVKDYGYKLIPIGNKSKGIVQIAKPQYF